ncbi:MAG: L-lactate dehydrogenase [Candidatus Lokiarchaeia archaeon]|nr:L-lactate dehydrogenase [Candidatus Lokiarchaeia archaeon]
MKKEGLHPKISIIGCGNVGVRYAYALIIKGIAREIVMVDINRKRLEGEVMDLSHTAPYTSPVNIIPGNYEDIKESDIVVITAGKNQEPGETRLDLVNKNVNLFKSIIPKIQKYDSDAVYLIVSNPVDILSYATYKISGKSKSRVMGSGTTLDTARFRYLLAKYCNVNASNIHAYILGEHGDSEFAVWSSAMVGGAYIRNYCDMSNSINSNDANKKFQTIFEEVRDSAYKIIERKGETSYGIGLALARISQAIINDENTILPVSTLIEDFYGISDLYLSLPSIINKNGVQESLKITLNEKEIEYFKESANKIRNVLRKSGLL